MSDAGSFRAIAERYCAFVDRSDELSRGAFVRELEEQLISLYAAALLLPTGQPSHTDAVKSLTFDDWRSLHRRLSALLDDLDEYALIYDPYESEQVPVVASLADDVADIYRDLKNGLTVIEAGGPDDDAVWEWRFGFDTHWGRHVAHALPAVHFLTHGGGSKWAGDTP